MSKYYIHVTVNSPRGEYDYKAEADSVDTVIAEAIKHHPSATSLLVSIVPNRDGNVTLGDVA